MPEKPGDRPRVRVTRLEDVRILTARDITVYGSSTAARRWLSNVRHLRRSLTTMFIFVCVRRRLLYPPGTRFHRLSSCEMPCWLDVDYVINRAKGLASSIRREVFLVVAYSADYTGVPVRSPTSLLQYRRVVYATWVLALSLRKHFFFISAMYSSSSPSPMNG